MPDASASTREFERELLAGLERCPRSVPPKFFYDAEGSRLFDRICDLPEYYPTRTELQILEQHAGEIAGCIGPHADIIEFGAGASRKVRCLLEALDQPRRFVPIDISAEHLHVAADLLRLEHPGLLVQALAVDFTRPFELPALPPGLHPQRRVGFFPGSSIGNFSPGEALRFLRDAAALLRGGTGAGGMLVGVDLIKDPGVLHAAYNDAAGVTAAFNLNLLARANRELGTDFDLAAFDHYAFYEPRQQRIEMHLLSRCAQRVHLAGRVFDFVAGQSIHTENSHKYGIDDFRELASRAGFVPGPVWCDARRWFSLHWLSL
ncbi:MAG: L-histidine N(alpha)-methyltransferase [Pseudomonadota bacterium]|jgi:dimethylhistidine N-methyltransferase